MDRSAQAAMELENMGRLLQAKKSAPYKLKGSPSALVKAIKAKCHECSGGDRREVENCAIPSCPLYPYRAG